ncbi:MAG: hypothetical protein O2904_00150 [bacterium]|nr:hypothetical protein [bacterium]
MSKKIDKSYHLRRINIALTGVICLAITYGAVRPMAVKTTVQFDGAGVQSTTLPFYAKVFPSKYYVVKTEFQRNTFSPTFYTFIPDDCIEYIKVNDNFVPGFQPFCDRFRGRTINLRESLVIGVNTLEVRVRDTGWYTGLKAHSSVRDPVNILLMLLLVALLYWFILPYIDSSSQHSLESLYYKLPKRKRLLASHVCTGLLSVIVFYAMYIAMIKLGNRVAYEFSGAYTVDSPMYWAVGRGILNGLVPYVDLWESKPPGIFLLSALSIWMTDTVIFGHILQGICIIGIPFLFASIASHESRKLNQQSRLLYTGTGLLIGTLFALYSAQRSGEYQVESFGAFFGILYVWVVVLARPRFTKVQLAIATLSILAAVGLKEPFLLSILAASLLLNRSWEQTLERCIKPLFFAALIGTLLMAFLGFLHPYLTVYLPEMLGKHISSHSHVPLFERAQNIWSLVYDIEGYSKYLYFIMIVSLISSFMHHRKNHLLTWTMGNGVAICVAIFLLSLAVGIGGQYYNHHFAFAIPGYAAIAVVAMRSTRMHWYRKSAKLLMLSILSFSAIGITQIHQTNFSANLTGLKSEKEKAVTTAQAIDGILEACGKDTYMFLGSIGAQPYAYTDHSPMGPIFFQLPYLLNSDRPEFQKSFVHNLHTAELIVLHQVISPDLEYETKSVLNFDVHTTPWECAKPYQHLIDPKYTLYYRGT